MKTLDGKALGLALRTALAAWVTDHQAAAGRPPGLTVLLAGNDPASSTYVRSKERAAAQIGMRSELILLPESATEQEMLDHIARLNADPGVDGILLQLPLPAGVASERLLDAIDASKDVDGFHPSNSGALWQQRGTVAPCTPLGIIHLLDAEGIELAGLHAVVVGRSNIVGRPMAELLLQRDATVTIAHSRTGQLASLLKQADLVVAAIGRPQFIRPEWLKPSVICIDVGINRSDQGLVGDFLWSGLDAVASAATPVPGGVGPMTIATLMHNTVCAWARHCGLPSLPRVPSR